MRLWNFLFSHLHIFWVEIACLGEMMRRFITSFWEVRTKGEMEIINQSGQTTFTLNGTETENWLMCADVIANCWDIRHAKITKKGEEFVSFQVDCCRFFFLSFTFNSFLLWGRRSEWQRAYIDIVNIFQRSSSFNSLLFWLFSLLFFGLSVSHSPLYHRRASKVCHRHDFFIISVSTS